MADEEKIKDYDRLQYEYAQIHQKYRRLSERQQPTEPRNNADTKQLIIGDVSGSYFELEFGNHLRAKMIIEDGKMKVVSAVNGWGDGVPLDEIDFVV